MPAAPTSQRTSMPASEDWPVAGFENSVPVDEAQRAGREVKSSRYNKSLFGVKGAIRSAYEDFTVVLSDDWEAGLPALPVPQSSLVMIGTVLDAQGFVSADQTGVYSEFTTRVDEVIRPDAVQASHKPGDLVVMQRSGGRVQGRSARVLFRIFGQNMPRPGRQYVLFLQRLDGGEDYKLITGYELRGEKVSPLDSVDTFATYNAMDRPAFLQALRAAAGMPR